MAIANLLFAIALAAARKAFALPASAANSP
jgi:hypothetical protein